jgi:Glycosyltransferase Family 4
MNGLRVLITNVALAGRTGSEMYVHDLALALAARGHTPLVYTPQPGPLAEDLARRGVEVRGSLADFSAPPDIVHGQHTVPTISALRRFPGVPALYVCHDATARVDTPPIFPRILRHVAVDHNCRERVVNAGVPPDRIRVVYNSVDLSRFTPRPALPARPSRALLFSNYADERTHLRAVREACARAHLPLDVVGRGVGTATAAPEAIIGDYDLVFAKARCALEAMAVGTAVILCDFRGTGEMVTSADVSHFQRWNFGARLLRRPLDPQLILDEIRRYDAADAAEVSRRDWMPRWASSSRSIAKCSRNGASPPRRAEEAKRAPPPPRCGPPSLRFPGGSGYDASVFWDRRWWPSSAWCSARDPGGSPLHVPERPAI